MTQPCWLGRPLGEFLLLDIASDLDKECGLVEFWHYSSAESSQENHFQHSVRFAVENRQKEAVIFVNRRTILATFDVE